MSKLLFRFVGNPNDREVNIAYNIQEEANNLLSSNGEFTAGSEEFKIQHNGHEDNGKMKGLALDYSGGSEELQIKVTTTIYGVVKKHGAGDQ